MSESDIKTLDEENFVDNDITWESIIQKYNPATVNDLDEDVLHAVFGFRKPDTVSHSHHLPPYYTKLSASELHPDAYELLQEILKNRNTSRLKELILKYAKIDTEVWCKSNAAKLAALRDYRECGTNRSVLNSNIIIAPEDSVHGSAYGYAKHGFGYKYIPRWYKTVGHSLTDRCFLHPLASYHKLLNQAMCSLLFKRVLYASSGNEKGTKKVFKNQVILVFVLPIKNYKLIPEGVLPDGMTVGCLDKTILNFHIRTYDLKAIRNNIFLYSDVVSPEYKYTRRPMTVVTYVRNNKAF